MIRVTRLWLKPQWSTDDRPIKLPIPPIMTTAKQIPKIASPIIGSTPRMERPIHTELQWPSKGQRLEWKLAKYLYLRRLPSLNPLCPPNNRPYLVFSINSHIPKVIHMETNKRKIRYVGKKNVPSVSSWKYIRGTKDFPTDHIRWWLTPSYQGKSKSSDLV